MKERIVRGVAGGLILVSLLLAVLISIKWLYLGVFVGLNLLQSSLSQFCPLEKILERLGVDTEKKP